MPLLLLWNRREKNAKNSDSMKRALEESLAETNVLFGSALPLVSPVEKAEAAHAHALYYSEYSFLKRQTATKASKEAIVASASSAVEAAMMLKQKAKTVDEPMIGE